MLVNCKKYNYELLVGLHRLNHRVRWWSKINEEHVWEERKWMVGHKGHFLCVLYLIIFVVTYLYISYKIICIYNMVLGNPIVRTKDLSSWATLITPKKHLHRWITPSQSAFKPYKTLNFYFLVPLLPQTSEDLSFGEFSVPFQILGFSPKPNFNPFISTSI